MIKRFARWILREETGAAEKAHDDTAHWLRLSNEKLRQEVTRLAGKECVGTVLGMIVYVDEDLGQDEVRLDPAMSTSTRKISARLAVARAKMALANHDRWVREVATNEDGTPRLTYQDRVCLPTHVLRRLVEAASEVTG